MALPADDPSSPEGPEAAHEASGVTFLTPRTAAAGSAAWEVRLDRPWAWRALQHALLDEGGPCPRPIPILSPGGSGDRLLLGPLPADWTPPAGGRLRGPAGNGLDPAAIAEKDLLVVGAGDGAAVLRPLLRDPAALGGTARKVTALIGARRREDLPFPDELQALGAGGAVELRLALEQPDQEWKGACGVVPVLFRGLRLDPPATVAVIAGDACLIKFAVLEVLLRGVPENAIHVLPERGLRCGPTDCPECAAGFRYACRQGPVFRWPQVKTAPEPYF